MSSPEFKSISHTLLTQGIHACGVRLELATTGGGSLAISALLTTPGASRSVVEAVVPYSAAALGAYLGSLPEQFCSEATARRMAMAAYQRARSYDATDAESAGAADLLKASSNLAGIGCTCSLVSDRPKRGAHRIHCAAQTSALTATASLDLIKGARSRLEEEEVAAAMLLNVAALAAGLAERVPLRLRPGEQVEEHCVTAPELWRQLFTGARRIAPASGEEQRGPDATLGASQRRVIFPGAFHPLHAGHLEMAQIAASRLKCPIEWEISIANVDKPPIDYREMELRSAQFKGEEFDCGQLPKDAKLWFTWAPTFAEKSELFPHATFLVGADTIARIAEPRYYGDDMGARDTAIAAIAEHGGRFLVFGRAAEGAFQTIDALDLPPALRAICDEVPADAFRHDISSTDLRRHAIDKDL
ncbi:MAG TPA: hypothetical protein VGJ26_11930 [Pirellulales bacterium]